MWLYVNVVPLHPESLSDRTLTPNLPFNPSVQTYPKDFSRKYNEISPQYQIPKTPKPYDMKVNEFEPDNKPSLATLVRMRQDSPRVFFAKDTRQFLSWQRNIYKIKQKNPRHDGLTYQISGDPANLTLTVTVVSRQNP